jgi:hypothetical protein
MSIFENGGFVGKIADYKDTSRYVITPGSSSLATLVYVGGSTQSGTGTTSNISISLTDLSGGTDTAPLEGDMVIIAIEMCGTTNKSYRIANYTQIADLYANDTEDSNLNVGYRFMGTTPDTTATITGGTGATADAFAAVVQVWRNVDPTTPMDVTPTTVSTLNTAIPNPPAITPITAGAQILAAAGSAHTGGAAVVYTASYLSNFRTISGNSTNDATVGMGNIAWTSGAYDPAAWTWSGTNSTAFSTTSVTFALRPATIVVEEILGNRKNSGIWSVPAVWKNTSSATEATIVWSTQIAGSGGTNAYTGEQLVGDVLFGFSSASFGLYDYDGGGNPDIPQPTAANGFSTIYLNGGQSNSVYLVYKIITEDNKTVKNYFSGNSQLGTVLYNIRGLELTQLASSTINSQSSLTDTTLFAASGNTTTDVNPSSITPAVANSIILTFSSTANNTFTPSLSDGYTLINNYQFNIAVPRTITTTIKQLVPATAQDPPSFGTGTSQTWNVTMALRVL